MSDRRVVQCFGTRRRPGKPDRECRRQYVWTAKGASGNFGPKGVQACPYCGTMPDFKHPVNQYLCGQMTKEQALAALETYEAEKK